HLWDGNEVKPHLDALHSAGLRAVPLNDALFRKLQGIIRGNIDAVKSSPFRAAYALDDEISWRHFVHPAMWRVTVEPQPYEHWLQPVDRPLVQSTQRDPGGDEPFPQVRRRRRLADLVLPRARQPRLHRMGRRMVRRRQAQALARSSRPHVP